MTWGEEETLAGRIDFTDMIYWVVRWDLRIYQHNWVFVDEAQDLNPMQRKMIQKALSKQGFIIIIGDVRQSIYRFAGADSDSFMQTVDMFNADILPLTVTRRCARIITQHAQSIVPEFRALESAERGKVVYREEALLVKDVQPRDMVICRVKAPLVATALELIGDGIPATILGSDIGRALVALAEKVAKQKGFRFEDFDLYLQTYQMKQVSKWIAKGDEARADAVRDECEALRVILESQTIRSLGDLESAVNNIFGDTEGDVVTLTTAHKSKGLEAKRVFLLKPEKMPLNYPQMHPEAVQQEDNLHYVAITRAQEVLVVLMNDTWRSKDGIIPPYAQTNFEDVVDEGAEEGSQENAHEGADGSEGEVIDGNTDADIHDEETQEDIQVPDTPQETWRKWARDLMESGFVVVDFETTGLNPRIEEITQIAIIDHEGRTLMNTLVKPQRPIQYGAQKVTGITPDKVKDAPNFREVYDNLMSALDGETVLAYNAPFDEQVLASTCHIHDGIPPMSLWGCVMRAYAQYNDNKTSRNGSRGAWWKLTEAMEQENLPLLDAHDALADVRMTLNLVRRMAGMDPLTFEDKDEIEDSPIGESAPEDATRVRLTLDNAQVGGWICYKGHPYRVLSVVEEWKTVNAIMSEEYRSRWTWRELSELGIHATVSIQPHQTVAYLGKCEECAQDDTKGDAKNDTQDDAQERSKTCLYAKNDANMTQHTANSVKTQGDDILTPPQPIQKPTLPATFPQPPASDRLHQLIQTMSESETEILLDLLQEHLDTLRTQRMRETVGRNPKPEVSKAIVQA
jgi:DNA polymerase III epsilon subunit-like protein